jgi:hypothetical protein
MNETVLFELHAGVFGFDRNQGGVSSTEKGGQAAFRKIRSRFFGGRDPVVPGGGVHSQKLGTGSFQQLAEGIAGLEQKAQMVENADRVGQGLEKNISVKAQKSGAFCGSLPTAIGFP